MPSNNFGDALNDECAICEDKKKYSEYALCEGCKLWYHPKCLKLDPKVIREMIGEFICIRCKRDPPQRQSLMEVTNVADTQQTILNYSTQTILDDQENEDSDQETTNSSQSSYNTDEEGYAEIESILDWKRIGNGRSFLVKFKKIRNKDG